MLDLHMEEGKSQYYLRAEPSREGRALLRGHQEHLATVLGDLKLNPRFTDARDLHWTTIFLGSPARWTSVARRLGSGETISSQDLLDLALPEALKAPPRAALPQQYNVFLNGGTRAVFVLNVTAVGATPAALALQYLQEQLHERERSGRLPQGFASAFFRHRAFPLARERNGGRPHITLARGRVSLARQRDVVRSIRATPLMSREPLRFERADVRIARSPEVISEHA